MLARVVNIVNNVITMSKPSKEPSRTTVSLPPELNHEASQLVDQTGISLSDLLRQGMIRLLLESRETGSIRLLQLPKAA